jgi:hypothetical protein
VEQRASLAAQFAERGGWWDWVGHDSPSSVRCSGNTREGYSNYVAVN